MVHNSHLESGAINNFKPTLRTLFTTFLNQVHLLCSLYATFIHLKEKRGGKTTTFVHYKETGTFTNFIILLLTPADQPLPREADLSGAAELKHLPMPITILFCWRPVVDTRSCFSVIFCSALEPLRDDG